MILRGQLGKRNRKEIGMGNQPGGRKEGKKEGKMKRGELGQKRKSIVVFIVRQITGKFHRPVANSFRGSEAPSSAISRKQKVLVSQL